MDRLSDIFKMRIDFMESLTEKFPESYPSLPIDLSEKENQQLCRDMALRGVEEMFEAVQLSLIHI